MNTAQSFTLVPFEPLPNTLALSITGHIKREKDTLSITYQLSGDLDSVQLPSLNISSDRTDRLWEHTCLEFFLTTTYPKQDQDPYWEFNLSPSGSWNVFSLASYRQGLQEETAFTALPFTAKRTPKALQLDILANLTTVLPAHAHWTLGLSAVIILKDGTETFWALTHSTPTADFHSANSFTLTLPQTLS